jgi:hypothetical protein
MDILDLLCYLSLMAIEELTAEEAQKTGLEIVENGFMEMVQSEDPKVKREGLQGLASLYSKGLLDPNETGNKLEFSPPFTPEFLSQTLRLLYDLFGEGGEIHGRRADTIEPVQETIYEGNA